MRGLAWCLRRGEPGGVKRSLVSQGDREQAAQGQQDREESLEPLRPRSHLAKRSVEQELGGGGGGRGVDGRADRGGIEKWGATVSGARGSVGCFVDVHGAVGVEVLLGKDVGEGVVLVGGVAFDERGFKEVFQTISIGVDEGAGGQLEGKSDEGVAMEVEGRGGRAKEGDGVVVPSQKIMGNLRGDGGIGDARGERETRSRGVSLRHFQSGLEKGGGGVGGGAAEVFSQIVEEVVIGVGVRGGRAIEVFVGSEPSQAPRLVVTGIPRSQQEEGEKERVRTTGFSHGGFLRPNELSKGMEGDCGGV
jgi:hypothetical protein